jgi:uncharacterized protein (DUF697 family)
MQFQTYGMRLSGWRAALIGVVAVVLILVAVFLGFFILLAGLVGSAIAALIYAVRGRLGWAGKEQAIDYATAPTSVTQLEVREIQVDEVCVVRPGEDT